MTSKETKRRPTENFDNDIVENKFLILHNDDVHSFEYVTHALIEVCKHSFEQATQCTMITHYKGKCDVKKEVLKP
ncbi:MAG: ATP-dependent Clp protease adaptor ClpS [Draconibacterium sp.]|nr:ATP-dependent Clp protease adaptor ClpS [Draconibacterium sp.]